MAQNAASAQEQLTYTAILQIISVIVCIIIVVIMILPRLQNINAQTERTNEVIAKYEQTEDHGIPFSELQTIITRVGDNSELQEIIKANTDASKEVIQKKSEGSTYLQWLEHELRDKEKYEQVLREAKSKINTILPTLSPISGGIEENNIKLHDYIEYIETKILKEFLLESTSPLGIDSIQYGDNEKDMVNPIGYFDTTITFKGRNKNIADLLDALHKSGNPSILTSTGESLHTAWSQDGTAKISNPLIIVESFALDSKLDIQYPTKENSGRITLRMYIRGASETDKQFLVDTFNKRKWALMAALEGHIKTCRESDMPCPKEQSLQDLLKRVKDLSENNAKNINKGVAGIYFISQQIDSLKALENEFEENKLK